MSADHQAATGHEDVKLVFDRHYKNSISQMAGKSLEVEVA